MCCLCLPSGCVVVCLYSYLSVSMGGHCLSVSSTPSSAPVCQYRSPLPCPSLPPPTACCLSVLQLCQSKLSLSLLTGSVVICHVSHPSASVPVLRLWGRSGRHLCYISVCHHRPEVCVPMPRLSAFLSICIVLCCRLRVAISFVSLSVCVAVVCVSFLPSLCCGGSCTWWLPPPPLALLLSYFHFHFHFLIRLGQGYGIHGCQLIGCIELGLNMQLACTVL